MIDGAGGGDGRGQEVTGEDWRCGQSMGWWIRTAGDEQKVMGEERRSRVGQMLAHGHRRSWEGTRCRAGGSRRQVMGSREPQQGGTHLSS